MPPASRGHWSPTISNTFLGYMQHGWKPDGSTGVSSSSLGIRLLVPGCVGRNIAWIPPYLSHENIPTISVQEGVARVLA